MNGEVNIVVVTTAVVITAEAHNPTILHPAFLAAEDIVPDDWKIGSEASVSTPALSIVQYENKVSFLVDPNKIQISDSSERDESEIAEIATRYVEKLPHVHYTGVGVNIQAFASHDQAEQWLLKRFIASGPWSNEPLRLQSAAVKLVYSIDNGILNLQSEAGSRQKPNSAPEVGIVVNANYHTNISEKDRLGETVRALSLFRERIAHFHEITKIVFQKPK